jgi:hypothetical protein
MRAFIDNFQGSMIRAGTRNELSYTRLFFETRATITNITDEDINRYFQHGLFLKNTYHDFRRNRLTTAMDLRDMMARWADQEDEENNHFPKRTHDK